jgi:hypothetical protein
VAFHLANALRLVTRPGSAASIGEKRQYSDDLSRVFTREVGRSLRTHFPRTVSGRGTGVNAASAAGIKSVDVAFNIEGLFLGLGISVKVVGLPEPGRGYSHNLKRISEEWTQETINYHRYMPYSIIVGMLFLPGDAVDDRPRKSSLSTAVDHFRGYRGRRDPQADPDLMEEIYIAIYEASGGRDRAKKGSVYFVSAEHTLPKRGAPDPAVRLTFEQVKAHLASLFRERNPRLRVAGMP